MLKLPNWLYVLAIVLALAGVAGTWAVDRSNARRVQGYAARMASTGRDAARDVLRARLEVLSGQAASAAQLPQLRANLASFDAVTLRDGFQNEPWWAPVRSEFRVYGVALAGESLDVIEGDGMSAPDLDVGKLVQAARAQRQTSALLLARSKGNWPYLASAAVIDIPGRAVMPVLVLGRPLDESIAKDLAARAGGAVALTDGKAVLLAAGEGREELRGVAEKVDAAPLVAEDGAWAADRTELLPGLFLWTRTSSAKNAAEETAEAFTIKVVLWAMIAAALVVLTVIAVRSREPDLVRPAPTPPQPLPAQAGASANALPAVPIAGGSGESGTLITPGPHTVETESVTSVQKAPALPGQTNVFGRYVLLDRLGEGGMAEVYTAVAYGAEKFRRTFVVKRLRPEMAREPSVVSAFIDEANLASSLVHSNIVPVFDFGKVGEEYFLAQEYILGRDLGRITRRSLEVDGKTLPVAQVFFVASETLKALEYAHARADEDGRPLAIVHRDVSPNNILVSARGEVKLFDFGIAKAEGRLTQTQAGIVKGNVRFMSPEQARGVAIDSRADLFSLALVVYYAIAGDALYGGLNSYELLLKAAHGPGPDELAKISVLPEPAPRILLKALQADPEARYQTAAELGTALHPYLAGAPAALSRTMDHLFGADIRDEEKRFAAAVGSTGTTGKQQAIK